MQIAKDLKCGESRDIKDESRVSVVEGREMMREQIKPGVAVHLVWASPNQQLHKRDMKFIHNTAQGSYYFALMDLNSLP